MPVSWMVVIFILSSIPKEKLPELLFPGFDKIAHLIEYFILGFLWARALGKRAILVILLGIIYGISDEIHQIFVPLREFSVLDLLVDSIGVIFGTICHLLLKR